MSRKDLVCGQCGSETAYREEDDLTKQYFQICTTCGYVEKKILKEDVSATKGTIEILKTYYNDGQYAEALRLCGFTEGVINSHTEIQQKRQVERLITHPLRVPMYNYNKETGYSRCYDIIKKAGFGTYKIKEYDGTVKIGRFANEKHRRWKTDELISRYDIYDDDCMIEIVRFDLEDNQLVRIL